MRTSMPPSGTRRRRHVVHEVAHQEDAAAARFQHVLGRERIGDALGVETLALVAHRDDQLAAGTEETNSTCTIFRSSFWLPCLMALMTDSRTATPTQCIGVFVESDALAQVIAHHLDEVQHVERAAEFEPDDVPLVVMRG